MTVDTLLGLSTVTLEWGWGTEDGTLHIDSNPIAVSGLIGTCGTALGRGARVLWVGLPLCLPTERLGKPKRRAKPVKAFTFSLRLSGRDGSIELIQGNGRHGRGRPEVENAWSGIRSTE